jgi:DHA1 family bicyclomycin/chloramphenicol resistance-like MFS transporter
VKFKNNSKHIIGIIILLIPLVGVGIDIYTPSLPAIKQYFMTNFALVRDTLAIYLVGAGVGQLIFGPWSDIVGRRVPLILSLVLFLLPSVLIVFSPNVLVFIGLRLVQGLGAAGVSVTVKAILADSFTGVELRKASASMTTAWAIGPIVAPVIGGYLQHYIGWQANFYFLFVYSLICLIVTLVWLPETNQNRVGYNLKRIMKDFGSVFSHKIFVAAAVSLGLGYGVLIVFNSLAPFLIQDIMHYSAIVYGHVALLLGIAYFIGNFINRFMTGRLLQQQVLWLTFIIQMLGVLILLGFALFMQLSLMALVLPCVLVYIGSAAMFPNFLSIALSQFRNLAGIASGAMGAFLMVETGLITFAVSNVSITSLAPISYAFTIFIATTIILYVFHIRKGIEVA